MSEPTIRVLDSQDIPQVAQVHLAAFPESALSKLGAEGVLRYYAWQMSGPHDAVTIGILDDTQLLGFCFAGVFHGALSGFLRQNIKFLIWRIITHPHLLVSPLIIDRVKIALRVLLRRPASSSSLATTPKNSFGMLAIAVLPTAQGRGLGKKIMRYVENKAREDGFAAMHLTVSPKNVHAIRFYERLGWKQSAPAGEIWRGMMTKLLEP